jgi:flagellar assembly protein FliH
MPSAALPADSPRIVKAQAAPVLGTPVAFNYADLRRACDDHVAQVQAQSRRVIEETAVEADRLRQQALEAGRRDGYREGLKAAEAEMNARVERLAADRLAQQLETVLPAVRQLADGLRLERDRWIARWEAEAIRLSVAIAEKLLKRVIASDPITANELIAEALRAASGAPRMTIRLALQDYERLGASLEAVAAAAGHLGEAEVTSDRSLSPGSCVIDTRHGQVDGRLDTLLDRIASELVGTPSAEASS